MPWLQLLEGAESTDYVYMMIGTLGSIVTGASIPLIEVLFGRMLDELNTDPTSFEDGIKKIALYFVYVAAANIPSGIVQVYSFGIFYNLYPFFWA